MTADLRPVGRRGDTIPKGKDLNARCSRPDLGHMERGGRGVTDFQDLLKEGHE
jgi:hypothetical protein